MDVLNPDVAPLPHAVKTEFRNYVNSEAQDRVSRFYREHHKKQTLEFVQKKKEQICSLSKKQMTIWEAVELLNNLVDESDPDTEYPQIMHLLQTSEAIRSEYPGEEYDWFVLVGFIHDLGKVLGDPSMYNDPQWSVVGDTVPVGCAFSEKCIFREFFEENPDYTNVRLNTPLGVYSPGCGFDNVHFSWGHDEYLYQVLVRNGCTLPQQALHIIRYHSFYPWHQHGAYDHLASAQDRDNLKWLKAFQKFDLYSKLPEKPDVEKLTPYYKALIDKYFPQKVLNW